MFTTIGSKRCSSRKCKPTFKAVRTTLNASLAIPLLSLPAMKSVFEPYRDLKDNLHKDLAAKLLATDAVIKQTITQIFRSKVSNAVGVTFLTNRFSFDSQTMIDSLSNSVANAIQTTMITSYRDTFNQIVIPSFEKAATNMFQQTNDVFKRGTKECTSLDFSKRGLASHPDYI